MNVEEILRELRESRFIGEMPPEHHVWRREREYEGFLEKKSESNYLIHVDNPEDFVLIQNGDIEFPDVGAETVERKLAEEGIDLLAWYRSFHWNPPERWGIYIVDRGVYYLAQKVFQPVQMSFYDRPFNTLDLLQQSFRLLFLHEFFHFITDVAASAIEVSTRRVPHYINYVKNVYLKPTVTNEYEPIEEALANAFAYRKFLNTPGEKRKQLRKQLRDFMKNQPNGYRAFDRYLGEKFSYGLRELGTCIRDGWPNGGAAPLEVLFDCHHHNLSFKDVPVYIVQTIKDPPHIMTFINSIPRSAILESNTFKRDLKKLPPEIMEKYRKTLRLLEYNIHHGSLKFEKIKGCDNVFTVRVDRNYRLSMRPIDGKWELLRIARHDEIYRKSRRLLTISHI